MNGHSGEPWRTMLRAYQKPPTTNAPARAIASGAASGRSRARSAQAAQARTASVTGAVDGFVPIASPVATTAGASRPGRPAVAAQALRAATQDSHAKAGRSVWASASWPTRSGVATSAATPRPAMAGATRSARRQVQAASIEHERQRRVPQRQRDPAAGDARAPGQRDLVGQRIAAVRDVVAEVQARPGPPVLDPAGDQRVVVDGAVEADRRPAQHPQDPSAVGARGGGERHAGGQREPAPPGGELGPDGHLGAGQRGAGDEPGRAGGGAQRDGAAAQAGEAERERLGDGRRDGQDDRRQRAAQARGRQPRGEAQRRGAEPERGERPEHVSQDVEHGAALSRPPGARPGGPTRARSRRVVVPSARLHGRAP